MSDDHDSVGAGPAWPAGLDQPPDLCLPAEVSGERPIQPAGLVLAAEGDDFRIVVIDEAGSDFMALGPFDEDEVLERWRSLAHASGLPRLVRGPDGDVACAEPIYPGLRAGRVHDRGRLVVLTGRRPRFLVRRKAGRLPQRPLVYREPVLAAGTR